MFSRALPIYLIMLIADVSFAYKSIIPRAFRSLHAGAIHQTHNLAQDLRVAFGGIIFPRDVPIQVQHVVYCKPVKQAPFGGGNGGGGNSSSITASRTTSRPTSTKANSGPTPTLPASSPWNLTDSYGGNDFFNGWDFFTGADPTNGIVDYVDQDTAQSSGLLEVNAQGNAIMRVETTPSVPGNRQSIRITTQAQYNGALVVMDAVHMPTGCGVWPAFWSDGPNWPMGGEIDIVEGVNDYTNNQATIHTNVGCTLTSSNSSTLDISGNVIGGTNCAALTTGNQGCGIRASTSNSFGAGFNANNGGTYAMKWDSTGIAVYFFPSGSKPADLVAQAPQPDSWGVAQARWPAAMCAPFTFFNNHQAIFDTTLCGDWAGSVWNDTGIPGQEHSCAQTTGFSTCEAFVRANGSAMSEAYWEVSSVQIYQLQA